MPQDWKNWHPLIQKPGESTLAEVKSEMMGNEIVHWKVMLLENPGSPLKLPGATTLFNHDCLHILLRRGLLNQDEAFVIGFSMGSDEKCKKWHVRLFKFLSHYWYPKGYKFKKEHFVSFDLGFEYARKLKVKNLHSYNFKRNQNKTVKQICTDLGIEKEDLNYYRKLEREKLPHTRESSRLRDLAIFNIWSHKEKEESKL